MVTEAVKTEARYKHQSMIVVCLTEVVVKICQSSNILFNMTELFI